MPDWKRIGRTLLRELETAAREARDIADAADQLRRRRGHTSGMPARNKICLFWECNVSIRDDHFFCYRHYIQFQESLIDECPGCSLGKYMWYGQCLPCSRDPDQRLARPSTNRWYRPEYSEAWEQGDAAADQFFVYILKLDEGKFYAGQTRELRERLSEHRDGHVQTTTGRNPKLVWFCTLPTREDAAEVELELKKLVASNPREVRRMVIDFHDLVEELDYT